MSFDRRRPRGFRAHLRVGAAVVVLGMFGLPSVTWGTVEEQRARLPPPADCSDPVEGIWMGMSHRLGYADWNEWTMKIRRESPGASTLQGEMQAHWWKGGEHATEPPPCTPGQREYAVTMTGHGSITPDGRVAFGSHAVDKYEPICGEVGNYAPDNFSGTIDPAIQEFQSVNNDGRTAVNEPVVFRRVKCLESHAPPAPNLVPPAFGPAKHAGCGR